MKPFAFRATSYFAFVLTDHSHNVSLNRESKGGTCVPPLDSTAFEIQDTSTH